jgi:translocation and assembly module TamA
LPKVERFFAGGDTTLRGFEIDPRPHRDHPGRGGAGRVRGGVPPLGGSMRILQNVDLQCSIIGPWFGAIFIDSGVVADSLLGLSLRDFRHGAGITPLLFKLPIGDISVSWAWPLDPQPATPRSAGCTSTSA